MTAEGALGKARDLPATQIPPSQNGAQRGRQRNNQPFFSSLLEGGPDLRLDRDAIEVRGLTSLDVETPWYGGRRHYEGIGLKRLLSDAGVAAPQDVHLHALNDYSVDLPWSVIDRYDPLLALKRDGEYMAVRDKGPLFLLFPFDDHAEIRTPWFYSRCIWQVDSIAVSS